MTSCFIANMDGFLMPKMKYKLIIAAIICFTIGWMLAYNEMLYNNSQQSI